MPLNTNTIDDLFTGLEAEFNGTLHRDDAYAVLLRLLNHARSIADRTTPTELWAILQTIPASEPFGGRTRLDQLLLAAERDNEIRRTATGHILLRLDAPSGGGPEHVWVRLEGRCVGTEVEITGADPWPSHQMDAPGKAWWRCTGCRTHSGSFALDFCRIRETATEHVHKCRALPAPPA
ncbi:MULTISPECIES: hypothetical protein [unclassified Streptomyces]|uniref:hypothetical protein n=1 Tax=unclassified Streptomyces TaxID=2593676 RepID=UPI002E241241|nr:MULTISPECIES: hypothetical protein [unclassified Streptomyces]